MQPRWPGYPAPVGIDPYVPATRAQTPREQMELPPAKAWRPTRPGDIIGLQPQGGAFGYQGPDQGYALKLASRLKNRVVLAAGESWHEAENAAIGVANRRASLFGRAPITDDVELAFLVMGFLPAGLPAAVVQRLTAIRHSFMPDLAHDPAAQRRVAESVAEDVVRSTPEAVRSRMSDGEVLVSIDSLR